MKLENSFEVDAPPEKVWALLMDVPRIIPCMPGAKLDETVSDSNWKATMQVKLGPIGLTFATDCKRTNVDEAARSVTLTRQRARNEEPRPGERDHPVVPRPRRTAARGSTSSPTSASPGRSPSTAAG